MVIETEFIIKPIKTVIAVDKKTVDCHAAIWFIILSTI